MLIGAGVLGASSDAMGSDDDDALHFGLGAKLALDDHVSIRLDLRDVISRRRGGSQGQGAHSPELLLGITFTPTRTKPDFDSDTVLDGYDRCPTEKGVVEHRGCPAPDADQDGIPDAADLCPDIPGDREDGCPESACPEDRDEDGVLDRIDACPGEPGPTQTGGCPTKSDSTAKPDGPESASNTELPDVEPAEPASAEAPEAPPSATPDASESSPTGETD